MPAAPVFLIIYTTKYRLGGAQFPVVARTLEDERRAAGFDGAIVCRAVESKVDVLREIAEIREAGKKAHRIAYGSLISS